MGTGEKAAGSLTLAGYAEGTKYHKAITVFNDGCGNVNLGKYRIDIYHNGGIKRNFYINLPNKILASGKSFNICNSNSKGAGYSKAWKKACGQYSKYLQHNGNDVIELYHGKDLIYTRWPWLRQDLRQGRDLPPYWTRRVAQGLELQ